MGIIPGLLEEFITSIKAKQAAFYAVLWRCNKKNNRNFA